MSHKSIKIIHAAARNAAQGSLDNKVWYTQKLNLFNFVDESMKIIGYFDIPVSKVIALNRQDFWTEGNTWRQVTHQLHGTGWTNKVFRYFESPLENNAFPAPSSRYEARFECIGGACECWNGNHRIVAGRAWLTNKYGEHAYFKKAKITYSPLYSELLMFFKAVVHKECGVRVCDYYGSYNTLDLDGIKKLFATTAEPNKIFAWSNGKLIEVKKTDSCINRLLQCFSSKQEHEKYVWREIPLEVVNVMVGDEWILSQLP
jgi:hypothetical protein